MRWNSTRCLRNPASALTQSPALSISSVNCTRSTVFFKRHPQSRSQRTDCEEPSFHALLRSHTDSPKAPCEFSLRVIELAQGWSDTVTVHLAIADLGYGGSRLHLCQTALYSRTQVPSRIASTSGGVRSVASNRTSRRSALHEEQIVHQQFLPQQLGYNLAIRTPSELIEICQQRCTLQRRQQRGTLHQQREEPVTAALAFVAHRLTAAQIHSLPSLGKLCQILGIGVL